MTICRHEKATHIEQDIAKCDDCHVLVDCRCDICKQHFVKIESVQIKHVNLGELGETPPPSTTITPIQLLTYGCLGIERDFQFTLWDQAMYLIYLYMRRQTKETVVDFAQDMEDDVASWSVANEIEEWKENLMDDRDMATAVAEQVEKIALQFDPNGYVNPIKGQEVV
jgi:hypothetical protein